jgi:hypothetical protein
MYDYLIFCFVVVTLSLCESNLFFSKINPSRGESPKLAGQATKMRKRGGGKQKGERGKVRGER